MTNKIRAGHDALWAVVQATLPDGELHRNPAGHKKPASRGADLVQYVTQTDDTAAEVLAVMTGPVYDLEVTANVVVAYAGKTRDERQAAAYAAQGLLAAALAADRFLGGAVDYADLDTVDPVDSTETDWLADGLEIRVRLLVTAPTRAG